MKHLLITKEDAENAGSFGSLSNCLVATALKRKFPNQNIIAGGITLDVGKVTYKMLNYNDVLRKFYDLENRVENFKPFIIKVEEIG